MNDSYNVPDSTDWLPTPLKDVAPLENALHCQICKEFYDTPMITSCNHTFCSRCIRTSLSADGKCPACRASDQASKLRNNWAMQEVVATFLVARPKVLEVARTAQEQAQQPKTTAKRKRPSVNDSDETESTVRTTRSKSRRIAASHSSQTEILEVEDSEEEQDLETKSETAPEDGLVECPLGCGKRMKEAEVFNHLDKCEDEKKQASRSKSKTAMSGGAYQSRSNPVARPEDRINELNYGMMNPTQLSKKLKEQGISNAGSKQLMINRHREWVNIWNANCDSSTPRSRRELLRELDIWERTQGSKAPQGNGLTNTVMRKDFDGDAYAKRHHDEFSRLIADAKRKNMIATTISTEDDADGRAGLVETKESQQHGRPPEDASEPANIDYKPYAHDPEALSNLHDKVQAMREGHVPEPRMNKGFQMPQPVSLASPVDDHQPSMFNTTIAPPIAESDPRQTELPMNITSSDPISLNESLMEKTSKGQHSNEAQLPAEFPRQNSRDEHTAHRLTGSVCDLPVHVLSSSPKKVPMFALPEQPVTDVDGGETHGI